MTHPDKILFWIPLLPLIGVFINTALLILRKANEKLVGIIGSAMVGGSFALAIAIVLALTGLEPDARLISQKLFTWISIGAFRVNTEFTIDPLSAIMILVVSGVSFVIHIYSTGYMHGEKGFGRFFIYLNLFVFSMLTLVMASNLLLMFVGWEGVGLCSYLLIGYYYEKKSASDAGKKAFVVNRIGDFGFLLGIFLCFNHFGTLQIEEIRQQSMSITAAGSATITAITLLFFLGATGKSAQIPLYFWLPDAMEGPTPVSALIHAATMVTAGVYMIARLNFLYALAPISLAVVACIGAITALFAATIGMGQYDIKRVLAYSTISQLGYMFLACGVGAFSAGIFHLMTHAFFKACLFLGAGAVMHALGGELDMRKMGGLRNKIPVTFWTFFIATAAISGIPGLSGFFSKDEILWMAIHSPIGHMALYFIGLFTAGLTAFYMFRAVFMTFFGEPWTDEHGHSLHVHKNPRQMDFVLVVLAIASLIGGYIGIPHILGGHNQFHNFLEPVMSQSRHFTETSDNPSLELSLMFVSVAAAVIGIFMAWLFFLKAKQLPAKVESKFPEIVKAVRNKYYVDEMNDYLFVSPIKKTSTFFLWKFVDESIIDGAANGLGKLFVSIGGLVRYVQNGNLSTYLTWIAAGAAVLLAWILVGI